MDFQCAFVRRKYGRYRVSKRKRIEDRRASLTKDWNREFRSEGLVQGASGVVAKRIKNLKVGRPLQNMDSSAQMLPHESSSPISNLFDVTGCFAVRAHSSPLHQLTLPFVWMIPGVVDDEVRLYVVPATNLLVLFAIFKRVNNTHVDCTSLWRGGSRFTLNGKNKDSILCCFFASHVQRANFGGFEQTAPSKSSPLEA